MSSLDVSRYRVHEPTDGHTVRVTADDSVQPNCHHSEPALEALQHSSSQEHPEHHACNQF